MAKLLKHFGLGTSNKKHQSIEPEGPESLATSVQESVTESSNHCSGDYLRRREISTDYSVKTLPLPPRKWTGSGGHSSHHRRGPGKSSSAVDAVLEWSRSLRYNKVGLKFLDNRYSYRDKDTRKIVAESGIRRSSTCEGLVGKISACNNVPVLDDYSVPFDLRASVSAKELSGDLSEDCDATIVAPPDDDYSLPYDLKAAVTNPSGASFILDTAPFSASFLGTAPSSAASLGTTPSSAAPLGSTPSTLAVASPNVPVMSSVVTTSASTSSASVSSAVNSGATCCTSMSTADSRPVYDDPYEDEQLFDYAREKQLLKEREQQQQLPQNFQQQHQLPQNFQQQQFQQQQFQKQKFQQQQFQQQQFQQQQQLQQNFQQQQFQPQQLTAADFQPQQLTQHFQQQQQLQQYQSQQQQQFQSQRQQPQQFQQQQRLPQKSDQDQLILKSNSTDMSTNSPRYAVAMEGQTNLSVSDCRSDLICPPPKADEMMDKYSTDKEVFSVTHVKQTSPHLGDITKGLAISPDVGEICGPGLPMVYPVLPGGDGSMNYMRSGNYGRFTDDDKSLSATSINMSGDCVTMTTGCTVTSVTTSIAMSSTLPPPPTNLPPPPSTLPPPPTNLPPPPTTLPPPPSTLPPPPSTLPPHPTTLPPPSTLPITRRTPPVPPPSCHSPVSPLSENIGSTIKQRPMSALYRASMTGSLCTEAELRQFHTPVNISSQQSTGNSAASSDGAGFSGDGGRSLDFSRKPVLARDGRLAGIAAAAGTSADILSARSKLYQLSAVYSGIEADEGLGPGQQSEYYDLQENAAALSGGRFHHGSLPAKGLSTRDMLPPGGLCAPHKGVSDCSMPPGSCEEPWDLSVVQGRLTDERDGRSLVGGGAGCSNAACRGGACGCRTNGNRASIEASKQAPPPQQVYAQAWDARYNHPPRNARRPSATSDAVANGNSLRGDTRPPQDYDAPWDQMTEDMQRGMCLSSVRRDDGGNEAVTHESSELMSPPRQRVMGRRETREGGMWRGGRGDSVDRGGQKEIGGVRVTGRSVSQQRPFGAPFPTAPRSTMQDESEDLMPPVRSTSLRTSRAESVGPRGGMWERQRGASLQYGGSESGSLRVMSQSLMYPGGQLSMSSSLVLGERIDPRVPLEQQQWYHGTLGRLNAESILRMFREGSYLVRNSETSQRDFSLSVKGTQCYIHLKISTNSQGRYILGQFSQPFYNIPQMIYHYSMHRLPIKGAEHISLMYPVSNELL